MDATTRSRTFSDAQAHAEAILGGQNHYYQISHGKISSSLSEVCVPGLSLLREGFTHSVAQYGIVPDGVVSFALPLRGAVGYLGAEKNSSAAAIYGITNAFDYTLHVSDAAELLILLVDEAEWLSLIEKTEPHLRQIAYNGQPIYADADQFQAAAAHLAEQFTRLLENPQLLNRTAVRKALKHHSWEFLLELHSQAFEAPRTSMTSAERASLVSRSRDFVLSDEQESVTIMDLCARFGVSRRTLQTCFLEVAGVNAVSYLRALRLCEVRRLLMASPREELSIGDAASRFGFYHLSHFTERYRELFGELPSQTHRPY